MLVLLPRKTIVGQAAKLVVNYCIGKSIQYVRIRAQIS